MDDSTRAVDAGRILTTTPTGYSGTPLVKKLGIKPGMAIRMVDAPVGFAALLQLPSEVEATKGTADLELVFATEANDLVVKFERAMRGLPSDGAIWVAWPKRASGVPTDITENRLRDLFLPTGMVDVKVIAIDETWSGLKFVVRKENRDRWPNMREGRPRSTLACSGKAHEIQMSGHGGHEAASGWCRPLRPGLPLDPPTPRN